MCFCMQSTSISYSNINVSHWNFRELSYLAVFLIILTQRSKELQNLCNLILLSHIIFPVFLTGTSFCCSCFYFKSCTFPPNHPHIHLLSYFFTKQQFNFFPSQYTYNPTIPHPLFVTIPLNNNLFSSLPNKVLPIIAFS